MPKPRKRCVKRRYRDWIAAEIALGTIQRVSDRAVVPKRTYPCPKCNGWHLTSMTLPPLETK